MGVSRWHSTRGAGSARELLALAVVLALVLGYEGFVAHPGLHGNDWPLLMWLAFHASWSDWSPLAIGHIGPGQLLLARWLSPLAGTTLAAAKALNLVAIVASTVAVHGIAARLVPGRVAPLAAAALFGFSEEALLCGQSEFADPLAVCSFLWGLRAALPDFRRPFLVGLLWGVPIIFRVHYQMFAIIAAATVIVAWRLPPRAAVALVGGIVIGAAPAMAVTLRVHGTLSSPVSSTFFGEALLGADNYDMLSTYDAHPLREVLAEHKLDLVRRMTTRVLDFPASWRLFLLPAAAAFLSRPHRPVVAALWFMSVTYYVVFISPGWETTEWVMLPVAAFLSVLTVLGVDQLRRRAPGGAGGAIVAAAVLLVAYKAYGDVEHLARERGQDDRRWSQNVALTRVLRNAGLENPDDAFVLGWDRVLVDDPRFIGYYNCGFWNLLVPSFRAARPNPAPLLDSSVDEFAVMMQRRGVRWIVIPRFQLRFPRLGPVLAGTEPLPGYTRLTSVGSDVVFARDAG